MFRKKKQPQAIKTVIFEVPMTEVEIGRPITFEQWKKELNVSGLYSFHTPYEFSDQTLVEDEYKKMIIRNSQDKVKELVNKHIL